MDTFLKTTLSYNKKIKLSNNGRDSSSDTGVFLFREFDDKIGFTSTLVKHFPFDDSRKHYVHLNEQLLQQKIYQFILTYFSV